MQKMKLTAVVILFVVVISVVQADYCPRRPNIMCFRASNKCCSDSDCRGSKICCSENCGNQCRDSVSQPTNGMKVRRSSTCKIDPF
ncbi:hypothetical protein NPIL_628861 [Nephila pilipes]|uniref:WAP domain-containing protein n=1 Tax=Nephila pilipes TaxID=299642 RepID=A0A8X6QIA0_NEPPI|nr:hypothetical protein NPIL_628861 [Nephila pilipes]